MPDSWNPQIYRERGRQWREAAAGKESSEVKDALLAIAEGYERLASLIELDNSPKRPSSPT